MSQNASARHELHNPVSQFNAQMISWASALMTVTDFHLSMEVVTMCPDLNQWAMARNNSGMW